MAQTGQPTVDFASFLTMIASRTDARDTEAENQEIVDAFQIYDRNNQGYITAKELR
jgi:Ca2+-binding EF-hand superfamily protein